MSRALLGLLAAAVAAGCGDSNDAAPLASLRQPAAIVAFTGRTIAAPGELAPYFAVANASRNDLALVNAVNDAPVLAPVQLEALRVHLERPALLASASLGDGLADLLVAVSAGDSSLQLVRTWSMENAVVDVLDLGADVVAVVALPAAGGTIGRARLAVALSGRRLAVVEYARSGEAIVRSAEPPQTGLLLFQPEALAAMPPDVAIPGDENVVYAASREPLDGPGGLALGVGRIDLSTPPGEGGSWLATGLDARAPTRLVAVTRLRERKASYPPPSDPATDIAPFDGQPEVERVYAVLDESACGLTHPIDCGVAILDPALGGLLPDPAARMPYLAPIQLGGRPLALAVANPPAVGPPDAPPDAPYAGQAPAFMRLWPASGPLATTAVGAVPLDTGPVVTGTVTGPVAFLDLGRWKVANGTDILTQTGVTPRSTFLDVPVATGTAPLQQRLWLKSQSPAPGDPFLAPDEVASGVTVTPGYTRNDTFSVTYQGILPNLLQRPAEAGLVAPGEVWLALQTGEGAVGSRRILQQVEIAEANLGVRVGAGDLGDVVQIDATLLPACLARLEAREEGANDRRFEARAAALLPATVDFPGGALRLEKEGDGGAFDACYDDLVAEIGVDGGVATGLLATIRARGLVLTSTALGYAGRPVLGETFALEYPGNEDLLDGEPLVLARKARPHYHVSEVCPADPLTGAPVCVLTRGPVVRFRVDLERSRAPLEGEPDAPLRDSVLQLTTTSGVAPLSSRPGSGLSSHPTGAVAYDRSFVAEGAPGYRFLVPYASGVVLDVTPATAGPEAGLIR